MKNSVWPRMNSSKPRRVVPMLMRLVVTNNGPSQENIAYKTLWLMRTIVLGPGTMVQLRHNGSCQI